MFWKLGFFKMGNALRLLYGKCFQPSTTGDSDSVGPPYTTTAPAVPEALSQHVVSSRKAQVTWYGKLLQAWKKAKPPPKTTEEVARLIVETLSRAQYQKADVEGLLEFYGLPHPSILAEISTGAPTRLSDGVICEGLSLPEGVKFEMHTLPATRYKNPGIIDNRHSEYNTSAVEVVGKTVPDGDGLNVYVNTDDPRESSNIPGDVLMAADQRSEARAMKNYAVADKLHQKNIESGYRVIDFQNEEILARKYRIRLRGIDAPEMLMPFGEKARRELVKLVDGKCLRVLVYGEDQYGRCVADVYCNHIFVQEVMLKKGLAWHYVAYDQRVEFATWQKEARTKKTGLWVQSNPEKPWEWRKKNKREGR
ncbi:Uncharacterized protein 38 [Gossypium arboreum]|uniref:Uncharacterized protein 38 n=1 Tax=Gossypium arboreum TaxID=29729 RepID=A0A0B0NTZ5_GOSAR|nr:Uncharacterized protein 38 [Gossypium arboreum]